METLQPDKESPAEQKKRLCEAIDARREEMVEAGFEPNDAPRDLGMEAVDGTQFTDADGFENGTPMPWEDERRPDEMGHFNLNNGVLAVVDANGYKWIGNGSVENQSAIDQLRAAGYTPGAVSVPFSNGERVGWEVTSEQAKKDKQLRIDQALGRLATAGLR